MGHFSESQLVRGFYFYAPSCPGGAGPPLPLPSTPRHEEAGSGFGVDFGWVGLWGLLMSSI